MKTTIIEQTKSALREAMGFAAAYSGSLKRLERLANTMDPEVFYERASLHPDALSRDIKNAAHDYQSAKANYETFCKDNGLTAYVTYNED